MALVKIKKMTEKLKTYTKIYADTHSYRLLPYSIVFDLLNYFQNAELNQRLCTALTQTLPNRESYHSDFDLWVDLEAAGNITLIMAKTFAGIFAAQIQEPLVIALTSKKMTDENNFFLYYLQKATDKVEIIVGDVNENFVPIDDVYLQWPCFLSQGNDDYTDDMEKILQHSWRCAELGAEAVAFKMLETGIKKARIFYIKQLYLVQLQLMRIATQHYTLAADEARPVTEEFTCLMPIFNLTKAWGSIVIKRVDDAEKFFELAGINMQTEPTDLDSLYRLDIYAYFQHVSGRIDNAFEICNRIRKAIEASNEFYPQITYVNSLGLARLYRAAGNFQESKNYVDKAFNVYRGKQSETDLIYINACYAKIYENQKNCQAALHYWLKAVNYWLDLKIPEALGWRAIRVIAYYDFKPRTWLETKLIDNALLKKLLTLSEQCGYSVSLPEEEDKRGMLRSLSEKLAAEHATVTD